MKLTKSLKQTIITHAKAEYPKECCGLIIDGAYYPCNNIAHNPHETFEICPVEFVALTSKGNLQAIVHSHPNGNAEPSEIDRVQMGLHGVDWVICAYGVHSDGTEYFDIKCHKPTPYTAPLLGREYHHGVQDCYAIVRDYYHRELDIGLPDFKRIDDWWEDKEHESLYENNFEKAGFVQIDPSKLQRHDVILCRVGRTHHVNHALIYLGDGKLTSESTPDCVGDCLILHHPHGRLSVREVYGESWRKRTAMVLRHGQLHRG